MTLIESGLELAALRIEMDRLLNGVETAFRHSSAERIGNAAWDAKPAVRAVEAKLDALFDLAEQIRLRAWEADYAARVSV